VRLGGRCGRVLPLFGTSRDGPAGGGACPLEPGFGRCRLAAGEGGWVGYGVSDVGAEVEFEVGALLEALLDGRGDDRLMVTAGALLSRMRKLVQWWKGLARDGSASNGEVSARRS